jgi:hypothetical protein
VAALAAAADSLASFLERPPWQLQGVAMTFGQLSISCTASASDGSAARTTMSVI